MLQVSFAESKFDFDQMFYHFYLLSIPLLERFPEQTSLNSEQITGFVGSRLLCIVETLTPASSELLLTCRPDKFFRNKPKINQWISAIGIFNSFVNIKWAG